MTRIAIEGNIGAGKSSILDMLQRELPANVPIFTEPIESWTPLLDLYYNDKMQYGFLFSLKVLLSFRGAADAATAVVERSPQSCRHVFTQLLNENGCLTSIQWDLFQEFYSILKYEPDHIIYLYTPPNVCYDRIQGRGRQCEAANVDLQYLKRIDYRYSQLVKDAQCPVHVLDGSLPREELHAQALALANRLLFSPNRATA